MGYLGLNLIIPAFMKSGRLHIEHARGNPYVVGVILARIAGALSMLWFPWEGLMATFLFDTVDAWFVMQKAGWNRKQYHRLDKYLDWVCYAVEFFIAARVGMVALFSALLVWRFVGQVLFMKTHEPAYFILAPNIFEVCYMWFVAAPLEHITDGLSVDTYWILFWFFVVLKMAHEAWLHWVWPSYLKTHGFPRFLKMVGYHNVGY